MSLLFSRFSSWGLTISIPLRLTKVHPMPAGKWFLALQHLLVGKVKVYLGLYFYYCWELAAAYIFLPKNFTLTGFTYDGKEGTPNSHRWLTCLWTKFSKIQNFKQCSYLGIFFLPNVHTWNSFSIQLLLLHFPQNKTTQKHY